MSTNNLEVIISQANKHITNISCLLKDIKSEILANFIHSNNKEVIIITNKATSISVLEIIEKYVKDMDNVDSEDILSPYLP